MTIARTLRLAALTAVLSVGVAALGCELFYLHWLRAVVASGNRQLLETTPEALDHDLRSELVPGTPQSNVEAVLRTRHLPFAYDAGRRMIRAEAPHLKGSNPLAETALLLWIQFDQDGKLRGVGSRVSHRHFGAPSSVE